MLGSMPYTLIAMGETNSKLMKKAGELAGLKASVEVVEGNESVHELVDWWTILNAGRAAIFVVSGLAGVYAALG